MVSKGTEVSKGVVDDDSAFTEERRRKASMITVDGEFSSTKQAELPFGFSSDYRPICRTCERICWMGVLCVNKDVHKLRKQEIL